MKRSIPSLLLALLALAVICSTSPGRCSSDLLSYIQQSDSSYAWEEVSSSREALGTAVVLNMTSQTWQGIPWKHTIRMYVPAVNEYPETAVLLITGGSGDGDSALFGRLLSNAVRCPVAILGGIPNQPLYGKKEDALIAYTFQKAFETGDMTWPLLLPMTKSAVRAMDAIQEYSKTKMKSPIDGFVVTGASKRGWTTWLTAAAEPHRVKGIMPMVYDNLNLPAQMKHQLEAYGTYSPQIHDYTELGLQEKMDTKAGKALVKAVDPWAYRDRITMPKLIINGANDPYWTVDSLNIYWDGLKGDKWVVYIPNARHDLGVRNSDTSSIMRVIGPMTAFVKSTATKTSLPRITWKYDSKGKSYRLEITTDRKNTSARLWIARSETRDFRSSKWEFVDMDVTQSGFTKTVPKPSSGYEAVFGEISFPGIPPYSLSTQVRVFSRR